MFRSRLVLCCILIPVLVVMIAPDCQAQQSDMEQADKMDEEIVRLYSQGRYADAIPLAKQVLKVSERIFGPDHPDVAMSLNNLALLYASMGDYSSAEPLYKRALVIQENALGPDHPDVAINLNNLAGLYLDLGDYARAEPLYKRSLAIREKAQGPDHPDAAKSLNNLAGLYLDLGDYARAEPLFIRSQAIRERALGPDHPQVAESLNNLAELYSTLGDYARAEPLYKQSLAIWEKALGPNHPRVAISQNNLAGLYFALGDYAHAEPLYKRSLDILEKIHGPDHPDVATNLNNLASLYDTMGDYTRAEPLYKRSLAIREKALGPDHPRVATCLNNLALMYKSMSDYARAEPLYKRALAISEKAQGPDHLDVATSLNNLGNLYVSMGDYTRAEPLYKRSLVIMEKALGPDHPLVAANLNNLAWLYAARGNLKHAHRLNMKALKIDAKLIDQVMGFASEKRTIKFLETKKGALEGALSLVAGYLMHDPVARKQVLDIWLRRKGIILEAQRRFQEALVYSDDQKAVQTFQDLAKVRAALSKLAFGGLGKEGPEAYRKKIETLEKQKQTLEAKLIRLSQSFARMKKKSRADSDQVARSLPKGSVLVEFTRIEMTNFEEGVLLPAHYLVFVLHAGQGSRVGLLDLGPAEPIDQAVEPLKRSIKNPRAVNKFHSASRKLYDLVFAPIQKELGQKRVVFLSPDGNLNLIPFEILLDPEGRYLIETFTFNYLASGRDALDFGQIKGKTGKALIIGDPDFDLARPGQPQGQTAYKRSVEMRDLQFSPLPGTREEVKAIHAILGDRDSELHTGAKAREDLLKTARSPRVLHLATHGFFLTDLQLDALRDDSPLGGPRKAGVKKKKVTIENPLLRSGLALAGANIALKTGNTSQSTGLLTAEKVLGLRLQGTEMVVLSACETGLGEVKSGEGVYGLRRAFVQAGAKSLVMSMWSVPDKDTQELMVQFYKNVQAGKMNKPEALRQAALKQIQLTQQRYGHTHPLFWGAFVYLGEPGQGTYMPGKTPGATTTTTKAKDAPSSKDARYAPVLAAAKTDDVKPSSVKDSPPTQRACFIGSAQ